MLFAYVSLVLLLALYAVGRSATRVNVEDRAKSLEKRHVDSNKKFLRKSSVLGDQILVLLAVGTKERLEIGVH